jgi:hypothetical protein
MFVFSFKTDYLITYSLTSIYKIYSNKSFAAYVNYCITTASHPCPVNAALPPLSTIAS